MKKCKVCHKEIVGRRDKIFCSVKCKNYYHHELRKNNDKAVKEINKILNRNYGILFEIFGSNIRQITIDRTILENYKFNFTYHTHCRYNSKGKLYHYVYNFAWMEFSNDKIMILKFPKS